MLNAIEHLYLMKKEKRKRKEEEEQKQEQDQEEQKQQQEGERAILKHDTPAPFYRTLCKHRPKHVARQL